MTMNEPPRMKQPIAILVDAGRLLAALACQRQNMSSSGAKMKMKKGLSDWNQVDVKPTMVGQMVCSSAQVCIVLPCCS
jgi:hypothetical protein